MKRSFFGLFKKLLVCTLVSLPAVPDARAQMVGAAPAVTPLVRVTSTPDRALPKRGAGVTGADMRGRQIVVSGKLEEALDRLLAGSALFRVRYAQVVRAGLIVTITYQSPFEFPGLRAATSIVRSNGRVHRAMVRIKVQHDAVELIAHEFEHIAEQLEGVSYHDRLASRRGGTRLTTGQAFETDRAMDAGRVAARQVRESERARKKAGLLVNHTY